MKKRHTIIVSKEDYRLAMRMVDEYADNCVEVFSTPIHNEVTFECNFIAWARFKKLVKKSGLKIEL